MAMHKPKKQRRFQDGGDVNEAEMKQRGLDASNKEAPVGFFERLRMGNIDDPNSEAYKKFGAGRGRAEAVTAETAAAGPAAGSSSIRDPQQMAEQKAAPKFSDGDVDERDRRLEAAANAPSRMPDRPARPGQSSSGRKPSAAPKVTQSPEAEDTSMDSAIMAGEARKRQKPVSAVMVDEGRKRQNAQPRVMNDEARKRKPGKDQAQEKARLKQMEKDQALQRVTPELALIGGASGFGLKALHKLAKKLATPKIKEYNPKMLPAPKAAPKSDVKALEAPRQRIEYDKAGAKAKQREGRAEKNRSEMLEENAKRYGLDPKSPGYDSTVKAVREKMGGKDFSFKKGGRVTASSASKRADGIAQRGKTRGRMY